ncbi:MAG: hypothetical protein V3S31_02680 [Dehalococcoidia bacterium]
MSDSDVDAASAAMQRSVLGRALSARDPGRLHLRFRAEVIQRYREVGGAQIVRSQTVGRVALPGRWSLDVGITADGSEVHLPVQDILERLPEDEWAHWVEHLVEAPLSANFLKMRQTAAACIDDGETEAWEA